MSLAPVAGAIACLRRYDLSPHPLGDDRQLRAAERVTHPVVNIGVLNPRLVQRGQIELHEAVRDGGTAACADDARHLAHHRGAEAQLPDRAGPLVDGCIHHTVRQRQPIRQADAKLQVGEVALERVSAGPFDDEAALFDRDHGSIDAGCGRQPPRHASEPAAEVDDRAAAADAEQLRRIRQEILPRRTNRSSTAGLWLHGFSSSAILENRNAPANVRQSEGRVERFISKPAAIGIAEENLVRRHVHDDHIAESIFKLANGVEERGGAGCISAEERRVRPVTKFRRIHSTQRSRALASSSDAPGDITTCVALRPRTSSARAVIGDSGAGHAGITTSISTAAPRRRRLSRVGVAADVLRPDDDVMGAKRPVPASDGEIAQPRRVIRQSRAAEGTWVSSRRGAMRP